MQGEDNQNHPADREKVTLIEPPKRFDVIDLRELWAYRELLGTLAMRQIRVRYKQTALGATWALLQPIVQMGIFTVILGRMAKIPSEGYPYPIFVYSGLLAWNYFAQATTSAVGSLVGNAHLVSKVYFPRLIIPFAAVLASLLDFAVAGLVMIGLMIHYDVAMTANLLALPLIVLGLMLAAAGVGTALGALNVAFRDLQHAMSFVMQVWLYATPVLYPAKLVPESLHWVLALNPMTGLTDGFRAAFLGKPFDFAAIGTSIGLSLVVFVAGALYFRRVERTFADVI